MSRSINYLLGSILLILTIIVFREIYHVGVPLLIAEAGDEAAPSAVSDVVAPPSQQPADTATPLPPTDAAATATSLPTATALAPTATSVPPTDLPTLPPTVTPTDLPPVTPTDLPTATDPPPSPTPTAVAPTAAPATARRTTPPTARPQGPWPTATPNWVAPTAVPAAPQSSSVAADTNAVAWWHSEADSAVAAGNGTWRVNIVVRVPTSFQYTFDIAYLSQARLQQSNSDGDDLYLLTLAGIGCAQKLQTDLVARQNGARMLVFQEFGTANGPVVVDAPC